MSMKIPLYQVDAFSDRPFGGNQAAVCPLDAWLPDDTLQSIAAENNLSETAFFVRCGDEFELRWFTPLAEVPLCGHATLATAFVILNQLEPKRANARFRTKSGVLEVSRAGDFLLMNLPSRKPEPCDMPEGLSEALAIGPTEVLVSHAYLAVYGEERDVANLEPDFTKLTGLLSRTVIVTAPGRSVDFVSRYFAPSLGVPEDPVTGSAHCTLIPYWSERLGKKSLKARQLSRRGGELTCEDRGDRVQIGGRAALYLEGTISVPT
jgi:PhzF family phenazine biosynthesis protein